jgi:hypothetical protein
MGIVENLPAQIIQGVRSKKEKVPTEVWNKMRGKNILRRFLRVSTD